MKIETLLDALCLTAHTQDAYYQDWTKRFPEGIYHRRKRQYRAFRERILRVDAEKETYIKILEEVEKVHNKRIAAKDERICDLQARIAELEAELELNEYMKDAPEWGTITPK